MYSLRKWFYRPKKEDNSKLALFYWADEELTMVATELDSFDGRTDPERCSILVSQLRICQDKVLGICNDIMDDAIPDMRANRDFRAKFPDDVLHENLAGQLWFGAECLAAGSNIIHREFESASMRPLAKALTRSLENVRCLLREQSLRNSLVYSEKVREALRIFDRLFAEFELCYVSAMVPIKSAKEYHLQQEIVVLFSETLIRALKMNLVVQDMVDDYDPSLMFTIPRLAIIWGLLLYPDGPFNVEKDSADLSELFRPFCNLLFKIRDLLWTLTESELHKLEKMLCSLEEPKIDEKSESVTDDVTLKATDDSVSQFYKTHLNSKQFIQDFYAHNFGIQAPEHNTTDPNEDTLEQPAHSTDDKKSDKRQNNNIEFEVEFEHTSDSLSTRKSTEVSENEVETLVSSDFSFTDYDSIFGSAQKSKKRHHSSNSDTRKNINNKQFDESGSDDEIKSDPNHSHSSIKILNSCPNSPKKTSCHRSLEQRTSSLEHQLNRLHDHCTCGVDSSSRERLTPSREIMRQVMSRVDIVPPGQRISTSVENSPRAYHHGLLSHSFPTQPVAPPGNEARRHHPRSRKKCHRKLNFSSTAPCDSEASPSRRYVSNYQNNTRSSGGSWSSDCRWSSPLLIPRVQHLRGEGDEGGVAAYSSCSSCQSVSSVSSPEWDSTSPDTSSYNSECQDDEEIALALQAAEIASRNKARSRFKSSRDLLHKLFVCVSGVADQLQTNYASDLRNILKSVFDMNSCQPQQEELVPPCDNLPAEEPSDNNQVPLPESPFDDANNPLFIPSSVMQNLYVGDDGEQDHSSVDSAEEVVVVDNSPTDNVTVWDLNRENGNGTTVNGPPEWMPDELSHNCMACKVQFTILRRRHHCRNCGKIFCSRCSSNSIPLPRFGHLKPVRVCNQCFMYQLTNLVMQRAVLQ